MKSLNLYALTRVNKEVVSQFENVLSDRQEVLLIKEHEYATLVSLISFLLENEVSPIEMNGFFFSYVIEHIGKEFDLLKIDQNNLVLNIELKSEMVPLEKMEAQLIKNRYYLKHLAPEIKLYTYVMQTQQVYKLTDFGLEVCKIDEVIDIMKRFNSYISEDIEVLFRARDFLISPLNTPDKFINGEYFLTRQQEEIKKEIVLSYLDNTANRFWGIQGRAGTGKTLLLYDLAKECSQYGKCCIIHSGMLCEGHECLNNELFNVDIIAAKEYEDNILEKYTFVFVDEAQRLYTEILCPLVNGIKQKEKWIVFSYDYKQVLSKSEERNNTPNLLHHLGDLNERKLTDKIRTNKEVIAFVRNMLDLKRRSNIRFTYSNIDVLYAASIEEANAIVELNKATQQYVHIEMTKSMYSRNSIDRYHGDFNTHQVIGQEFDNVMVIMDSNFGYNEEGKLEGKVHPNPNYIFYKLLFQAVSRAREKLCILVVEDYDLFEKILSIKYSNIKTV